jgi:aryl-alcohol dehydrogenase-like predicted oxidoreductase
MDLRTLGDTGLQVSSIGFGMWPIGGTVKSGDYGVTDLTEAERSIKLALEQGVTLYDCAPAYGAGLAEEVLGRALKGQREKSIITTKCGIYYDFAKEIWVRDSSKKAIIESAEQSLKRLQTDYIDLLLIHWPDSNTDPADAMAGLVHLKESGKVRFVGVSNFTIEQIKTYEKYGKVDVQQVGYNLFDRRIEEKMIKTCKDSGIGIMAYGSLCHGLLTGTWEEDKKFDSEDWRSQGDVFGLKLFTQENISANVRVTKKLKKIAATNNLSLPQLALAWVLANRDISVALVGMATCEEVKENVLASNVKLTAEVIANISDAMIEAQGTVAAHEYDFNNPERN